MFLYTKQFPTIAFMLCIITMHNSVYGSFLQELTTRLIARYVVRSGILFNPCTHLAITAGATFAIESNDVRKYEFYEYYGTINQKIDRNKFKQIGLGILNGVLFSSTVGLYWRQYPVSPTSAGSIVTFLSRCMSYGIAPAAAIANAYVNPLCGGMIPICIANDNRFNPKTAGYFSVGMFGAASALSCMCYGHHAPSTWITGIAALGSTLLLKNQKLTSSKK